MASLEIGLVGLVALFAAILAGVNAVVALGLIGALGLIAVAGISGATSVLSSLFFETTHPFHFGVVPLFLLMGYFVMRAGLGGDLRDACKKWLGALPGGLALSSTLGAAAFGAASGSTTGATTVFTRLSLPEMLEAGYDKRMASASIAIAGTLAVMVPPSVVMVIYCILTDTTIGGLLIAGVIPGILLAAVLCGTTLLTVWRHPDYAPRGKQSYPLAEKLYASRLAGPLILVIGGMILGLYFGILTPAEAGTFGAAATLALAIVHHRGVKGLRLPEILSETVKSSAMIFALIVCALVFSRFLALTGVANRLGDLLTALNVNRWAIVLIVVVIYLAFGMMMDAPAALAITLPITHPVMMKLGFDPIWFGVFIVLLMEIGAIMPPVGIDCFVVQASSGGRVRLEEVFAGLIPYVVAGLLMLVLLCLFPQLALYLPHSMQ